MQAGRVPRARRAHRWSCRYVGSGPSGTGRRLGGRPLDRSGVVARMEDHVGHGGSVYVYLRHVGSRSRGWLRYLGAVGAGGFAVACPLCGRRVLWPRESVPLSRPSSRSSRTRAAAGCPAASHRAVTERVGRNPRLGQVDRPELAGVHPADGHPDHPRLAPPTSDVTPTRFCDGQCRRTDSFSSSASQPPARPVWCTRSRARAFRGMRSCVP